MKNISVYIIIVLCLFVLSWCSSINNNDFDRKVECYKLWRQYIKDLESDSIEDTNRYYYIDWIYFSKKEQTCFMEFTESYNPPQWWEISTFSYIFDILKANTIISSLNEEVVWVKYLEIKNLIEGNPEYKSFNFN